MQLEYLYRHRQTIGVKYNTVKVLSKYTWNDPEAFRDISRIRVTRTFCISRPNHKNWRAENSGTKYSAYQSYRYISSLDSDGNTYKRSDYWQREFLAVRDDTLWFVESPRANFSPRLGRNDVDPILIERATSIPATVRQDCFHLTKTARRENRRPPPLRRKPRCVRVWEWGWCSWPG